MLIGGVVEKTSDPVAIIPVQAIHGAKPHKAFGVLCGAVDLIVGQPLLFREIAELDVGEILCQPALQAK
jgi:hypothetical protein